MEQRHIPPSVQALTPFFEERSEINRLRQRYADFVWKRTGRKGVGKGRLVLGVLLLFGVATIPFGIGLIVSALRRTRQARDGVEEELEFVRQAEMVWASPIMVNPRLRTPGDVPYPGLFLVSFQSRTAKIHDVATIGMTLLAPDENIPEADRATIDGFLNDETYVKHRRRRVPTSITGDGEYYVMDLMVHPQYLMHRQITDDLLAYPCLAEPGEQGRIRLLPYWLVLETKPPMLPPAWAERCEVLLG